MKILFVSVLSKELKLLAVEEGFHRPVLYLELDPRQPK